MNFGMLHLFENPIGKTEHEIVREQLTLMRAAETYGFDSVWPAACPVCGNSVDEAAARAATGQTAHGAPEVDPARGTRQFHGGKWYYFDTLGCRSKFTARPEAYLSQPGR